MPAPTLIPLQLMVILASARAMGWLFSRIRQPAVVGEMTAGLLLGPSVLGYVAPQIYARLFPGNLEVLDALSRLGVWLFLFLVGVELDWASFKRVGRRAAIISQMSIFVPFVAGALMALALYPEYAGERIPFHTFALFMGAAMSITAFPVLVRILKERGMAQTGVGVLAIACAAVDDVTAWTLLAVMVVFIHPGATSVPLGLHFVGLVVFIVVMLFVVRPLLHRATSKFTQLSANWFGILLILLFVSCAIADWIGVHSLFGAFLFGIVVPKHPWMIEGCKERLQPLTGALLLPLFFAVSGIRTNVTLVQGRTAWLFCLAIIAVAVAGKFIGAAVPARVMGSSWRDAGVIGALMNTRGLMELAVLNLGLELGVISARLFAMMVLMALVTTFMTGPLLDVLQERKTATATVRGSFT